MHSVVESWRQIRNSEEGTEASWKLDTGNAPTAKTYRICQKPNDSGTMTLRCEPESSLSRQQSTTGIRKDRQRIEIRGRKGRHARRQRAQLRLQAARHILRRDLIQQTDEIVGVQTELIVLDPHDARAARAERIEVVHLAGIAAQEHGVHAVHGDEVVRDVCECQRSEAVVPVVEDLLAFVEDESAAALLGAEEAAYEMQDGGAGVAGEVGEQPEEEAGGAVEEDDFRAEVEIRVFRRRLLVSHSHEVDDLWKAEIAIDGFVHHFEESSVEGEVVGLL